MPLRVLDWGRLTDKNFRRIMQGWVILISLAAVWFYIENRHRVDDIQGARLASCEQTYEGIRQVFKPFLSPPLSEKALKKLNPAQRAAYDEQQADQTRFNDKIDDLIMGCPEQIEGKETVTKKPRKRGSG